MEDPVTVVVAVSSKTRNQVDEEALCARMERAGLDMAILRTRNSCSGGSCALLIDALVDRYLLRELRAYDDPFVRIDFVLSLGPSAAVSPASDHGEKIGSTPNLAATGQPSGKK
jgi:hypothetical protein